VDRKHLETFASIPQRANYVLALIAIGLLIIALRIWHLTVHQHTSRAEGAVRARKHLVVEPAMRGTIRDRYQIMLAGNAIEYRVGVAWVPMLEVPRKITLNGQTRLLRKEYIKALSEMLSREVQLDPIRVQDVIYSHAVFSGTTPVILKTGLTEAQYYRLNMLAKDWPGLVVERTAKRIYPRGKSSCHVVGYTAPLNRQEYDRAISEIRLLREFVEAVERGEERETPPGYASFFAAKERLISLERRTYGLNDEIGKMGVEASFESQLRGLVGKKYFVTNAHGETVREAVGSKEAVPGRRLVLSISSELQEWCEQLLAMSEVDRFDRLEKNEERKLQGAKNPLLRGGAIVAIDPKTAEVVACASYPRFNPNDFVRSVPSLCGRHVRCQTSKWLEDETYVQKVWDLEWPMVREEATEKSFSERQIWLTWGEFTKLVLPNNSPVLGLLPPSTTVRKLLEIQSSNTSSNLVDFTRLLLRKEELPPPSVPALEPLSIDALRNVISAKVLFANTLKNELRSSFISGPFQEWREANEREFLAQCRADEKVSSIPPRPYLHYIEAEQNRQFAEWWNQKQNAVLLSAFSMGNNELPTWVRQATRACVGRCIHEEAFEGRKEGLLLLSSMMKRLSSSDAIGLLAALKGYDELKHSLQGTYSSNVRGRAPKTAQDLIRSFLSMRSSPLASFCHMQPSAQGSIFKLVVAYAALHQQLQKLSGDDHRLNPGFFRINDTVFRSGGRVFVCHDGSGKPIPQLYKGGRLPKSAEPNIGELDLIHAIGRSSNPYFALLASEYLESPTVLSDAAKGFGYGEKTGISLPFESAGAFPTDIQTNKTGLYTTAIGQHTLTATPLQTSVMLSTLANGGDVLTPRLLRMAIGPGESESHSLPKSSSPLLRAIGVDLPLWLAQGSDVSKHHIHITARRTKRHIDLAPRERSLILEGMLSSIQRTLHDPNIHRLFAHRPSLLKSLSGFEGQVLGKSSTAESYERLGLGIGQKPVMYNHTWFGGIFYPPNTHCRPPFDGVQPDLVVVVFLRYGSFGKDAAPLAASVAETWRAIRKRHGE
jgi:cell division protein FtsI/penicillin-binding protein 2